MELEQQNRFAVVLVRARNPSNIGAVARAMHDLGYADLRVVNEYPVPFEAAKSAVHAEHVLESATTYTQLAEAVADCTLVLGTSAVGSRALEHPLHVLRDAAVLVRQTLRSDVNARVALLFGSEKTGLTNEELSHCHALVTIPMNPRVAQHLSMNLGQAAAVCLYEIAQSADGGQEQTADPFGMTTSKATADSFGMTAREPAASGGDLERVTTLMQQLFAQSGYTRRHPANARDASVRRLVLRMGLSAEDATVWTGILRQLLHAVSAAAPSDNEGEVTGR